jgi:hypothetical protein
MQKVGMPFTKIRDIVEKNSWGMQGDQNQEFGFRHTEFEVLNRGVE